MGKFVKHNYRWLLPVAFVAIIGLTLTALYGRTRGGDSKPQEILLLAKDVSFYLPDRPDQPNPVLTLTRGRAVKLVVRNDEPGKVLHCFTIGSLGVGTSRDLATGESEDLTFTPTQTGTFAYACLMHPMMCGQVIVR